MPEDEIIAEVTPTVIPPPPIADPKPTAPAGPKDHWQEAKIKNRTVYGINYALAFVLLANGVPLEDTAKEWGVDPEKLKDRSEKEHWRVLIKRYSHIFKPTETMMLVEKSHEKLKRLQTNRLEIIGLAGTLRGKIQALAGAFDNIAPEAMNDTEQIANVAKSIASLTKAAKDIADMTMVAHGDENAVKHLSDANSKHAPDTAGGKHGPQIIINMPGALAGSRRHLKMVSETIEKVKKTLPRSADPQITEARAIVEEASAEAESNGHDHGN